MELKEILEYLEVHSALKKTNFNICVIGQSELMQLSTYLNGGYSFGFTRMLVDSGVTALSFEPRHAGDYLRNPEKRIVYVYKLGKDYIMVDASRPEVEKHIIKDRAHLTEIVSYMSLTFINPDPRLNQQLAFLHGLLQSTSTLTVSKIKHPVDVDGYELVRIATYLNNDVYDIDFRNSLSENGYIDAFHTVPTDKSHLGGSLDVHYGFYLKDNKVYAVCITHIDDRKVYEVTTFKMLKAFLEERDLLKRG